MTYLWKSCCIYMFLTSCAPKKQFPSRKLLAQANIQGYFRVIHMETYKIINVRLFLVKHQMQMYCLLQEYKSNIIKISATNDKAFIASIEA